MVSVQWTSWSALILALALAAQQGYRIAGARQLVEVLQVDKGRLTQNR
jgi:hypothetical protein